MPTGWVEEELSEHGLFQDDSALDVRPLPAAPGLAAGSPPTNPTEVPYPTLESGVQAAGLTGPPKLLEMFAPPPDVACQTSLTAAAATTDAYPFWSAFPLEQSGFEFVEL